MPHYLSENFEHIGILKSELRVINALNSRIKTYNHVFDHFLFDLELYPDCICSSRSLTIGVSCSDINTVDGIRKTAFDNLCYRDAALHRAVACEKYHIPRFACVLTVCEAVEDVR